MKTSRILDWTLLSAALGCLTVVSTVSCSSDDSEASDNGTGGTSSGGSQSSGGSNDNGGNPNVGGDGGEQASDEDHLYAITTVMMTEPYDGYFVIVDDLDAGELQLDSATEVPEGVGLGTSAGTLILSEGATGEFVRYSVAADASLTQEGDTLSFAAYEVRSASMLFATIVTPDAAYIWEQPGSMVRWNPNTMSIDGVVNLDISATRDDLDLANPSSLRGSVVRDGTFYTSLYWAGARGTYEYHPYSSFAIIDPDNEDGALFVDYPCPLGETVSISEDGTLYGTNYIHSLARFLQGDTDAPASCIAWLPEGETSVGDDQVITYRELTAGHPDRAEGFEGSGFRYLEDGLGIIGVFRDDLVTEAEMEDPTSAYYTNHWELWRVDTSDWSASRIENIDRFNGSINVSYTDEGAVVLLPSGTDFENTAGYRIPAEGDAEELFVLPGRGMQVVQIR